ncbi:M3 family oligoendopeptidase [Deinococcus sp.]|uniref:M3 family oligoendopeptidase n=1 Tax=Deinococcus sp. TaxID=47478 RepID=UPI0025F67DA2|nr:M3 family oligoendopeptidase [Deinococcus sp.]
MTALPPQTGEDRTPDDVLVFETAQTTWPHYAQRMAALERAELSPAGVNAWLHDWSELSKEAAQTGAVLGLRADLNTADEAAQSALAAYRGEVGPPMMRAGQVLRRKLLAVQDYTPAPDMVLALRRMQGEAEFYREANVPLEIVHAEQMQRYAEITGAQTVNFGGELTVPEAEALLGSADRKRRENVWTAMSASREAARPALNALMQDLLPIRRQLALNADLTLPGTQMGDYRAYTWRQLGRVDYTPQDCLDFHAAVLGEVVPLAAEIMGDKARQLGLDTLRPWDYSRRTALDPEGRPPLHPFESAPELEAIAQRVFDALDPELGARFGLMRTGGYLDLASRQGKMSHAYCESLEHADMPFVVMNVVGTSQDLGVLLHEIGHAFHFMASSRAQPLIWNRWSPLEFVEVPSMAMEYLALDQLSAAYLPAELERVRREQLEGSILFLPWAVQMDAFQHWLYTQSAELSIADLDAKWLELDRAYHPWLDWSGLDERERAGGWQYYHIFRNPFYYLEYAMCSLGAVDLWRQSRTDKPGTLARYKAALSLGNTATLPELYRAAGTQFRFDAAYLSELMTFLMNELKGAL